MSSSRPGLASVNTHTPWHTTSAGSWIRIPRAQTSAGEPAGPSQSARPCLRKGGRERPGAPQSASACTVSVRSVQECMQECEAGGWQCIPGQLPALGLVVCWCSVYALLWCGGRGLRIQTLCQSLPGDGTPPTGVVGDGNHAKGPRDARWWVGGRIIGRWWCL